MPTLKKTNVASMCILHIGSMHKQIIYFMLCVKQKQLPTNPTIGHRYIYLVQRDVFFECTINPFIWLQSGVPLFSQYVRTLFPNAGKKFGYPQGDSASPNPEPVFSALFFMLPGTFSFKQACWIWASRISFLFHQKHPISQPMAINEQFYGGP